MAIEILQQKFKNVLYFPAYEILLDELRDYRFYTDDMLHPSRQAVDYIWECFREMLIDEPSQELVKVVSKLNLMNNHRPFFPESRGYLMFDRERQELEITVRKKLESYLFSKNYNKIEGN